MVTTGSKGEKSCLYFSSSRNRRCSLLVSAVFLRLVQLSVVLFGFHHLRSVGVTQDSVGGLLLFGLLLPPLPPEI